MTDPTRPNALKISPPQRSLVSQHRLIVPLLFLGSLFIVAFIFYIYVINSDFRVHSTSLNEAQKTAPLIIPRDQPIHIQSSHQDTETPAPIVASQSIIPSETGTDKQINISEQDKKIADLQNRLDGLSTALASLQNDLQNHKSLQTDQQPPHTSLSMTLLFLKLREAALSGRSFVTEYQMMRQFSVNLPSPLQNELDALGPYADQNVSTQDDLKTQFNKLTPTIAQQTEKSQTETWVERTKSQLSNLIIIRHVGSPPASSQLSSIDHMLSTGNFSAVLDAIHNLPTLQQSALTEWTEKVKARYMLESILSKITDDLIASGIPTSTQQGK